MSETIENEILKLLKEISDEEDKLKRLEEEAENASREEYYNKGYSSKIKNCRYSLDRKIKLLRSLRGN